LIAGATIGCVGVDEDLWTVYGYGHWYRAAGLSLAVAVTAGVGWFSAATFADNSAAGIAMSALLWPALGVVMYVRLARRPYRLELIGDNIRWSCVLRQGELPARGLYLIERPLWFTRGRTSMVIFRPFRGHELMMTQHLNLGPFIRSLRGVAPAIKVHPSSWACAIGADPPLED
jgi:hypothetical protein